MNTPSTPVMIVLVLGMGICLTAVLLARHDDTGPAETPPRPFDHPDEER
ncbi:hypothetical protein [Streptomyces sp. NPDC051561]